MLEFTFDILTSMIKYKFFDLLSESVLSQGFEDFEGLKYLRLMVQKIDPTIP